MASHGHWGSGYTNDTITWNALSRGAMQGKPPESRDVEKLVTSARDHGTRDAKSGEFDDPGETDFVDAFERSRTILLNLIPPDVEGTPSHRTPIQETCRSIMTAYREGWDLAFARTPGR